MMRVECASADLQRVFNIARAAGIARPARTVRDIGSRGSRVSPHQGCLDIAVMLKGLHPFEGRGCGEAQRFDCFYRSRRGTYLRFCDRSLQAGL